MIYSPNDTWPCNTGTALAQMLKDEFENRQIIVVTHDRIWLEQLRKEQFVQKTNIVELLRWDIGSGSAKLYPLDVWNKIERDLTENDVNAASARLRRWAESFFRHVCHNFRISVKYRIDQVWSLADFFDPARGEIKTLLKKAKHYAQQAGDSELFGIIQALDDRRNEIYKTVDRERWVVNTAVHYNPSENISADEFRDVVKAFRDYHNVLHCSHCPRLLFVTEVTNEDQFIMCRCRKTCWKA